MYEVNTLIPTYDFPRSPILWLGFLGIAVALATVYIVNVKYAKSPFNEDNQK
mgnify:CR=1 FL=1|jgi:hypothetical protein